MSSAKRAFASLQPSSDLSLEHLENPKKKLKSTSNSNPSLELFALLRPSPFTLNILNTLSEPSSSLNGPLAINYQENTISVGSAEANTFNFNKIFEVQTSQEELMKTLALPLLEDLLSQGKSGLIFSYAPTNIERTSIFLGSTAEPGVLPHSIKMLLDMKTKVTQERLQKALKGVTQNIIEKEEDQGKSSEGAKESPRQDNRDKIVEMKVFLEAFEVDNQGYYDLLKDAKKGKMAYQNNYKFMGNKERSKQPALLKDIAQIELTSEQQAVKVLTNCRKNLEADDSLLLGSNSQSHITFRITVKCSFKNSPKNLFFFNSNSSTESQITASLCLVALGKPYVTPKPSLNKPPNSSSKAKPNTSPLGKIPAGQTKANLNKENKLAKVIGKYLSAENNLRLVTQLHANPADLEETIDVLNYSMKFKDPSFLNPINEGLPLSAAKGNNNSISPNNKSGEWESENKHQSSKKKSEKKSDEQTGRVKGKENKKFNVKKEAETEESSMKRSGFLKKATPSAKFFQARESESAINERDMRIQILEDALQKLQEKLLMECIGGKMRTMNENFKSSMQEISSSIDKVSPIPPVGLSPECFEFKNQQEGSIESFFERIQLNATASMVPVNINYFIFPGQMDKEGVESLSKVLNKDQGGSNQQNHVYVMESMARSQLMTKSQVRMTTPRKTPRKEVVDLELEEFRRDQLDLEEVLGVENLL